MMDCEKQWESWILPQVQWKQGSTCANAVIWTESGWQRRDQVHGIQMEMVCLMEKLCAKAQSEEWEG